MINAANIKKFKAGEAAYKDELKHSKVISDAGNFIGPDGNDSGEKWDPDCSTNKSPHLYLPYIKSDDLMAMITQKKINK